MKLTIIGCSGLFPSASSPSSSYLLEARDTHEASSRILLDLGNGALGPLQQYASPSDVDAVVVSSLSFDHCADLWSLYIWLRDNPAGQLQTPVHAPPGMLARLLDIGGSTDPSRVSSIFKVTDLVDESSFSVGPIEVTPYRTSAATFGVRIRSDDSIIAYTGETDFFPLLSTLANRADLLIVETSSEQQRGDYPRSAHMTGRQAGLVATDSQVGTLVLTHLSPYDDGALIKDQAAASFAGPIDVARQGAVYSIHR